MSLGRYVVSVAKKNVSNYSLRLLPIAPCVNGFLTRQVQEAHGVGHA